MTVDQKTNPVIVQRAERIMDAAAAEILRWGYQRVTVEDVAKRAGIGKGTVYLHWRGRDALFRATLLRELVDVYGLLIDRIRRDSAACLPHRLLPAKFAASMRRPLVHALLTRDTQVLGRMVAQSTEAGDDPEQSATAYREYLLLLRESGLVRVDLPVDHQLYLVQVVSVGGSLVQPHLTPSLDIPLRDKETTLAHLIRSALEPAGPAGPAVLDAAAPRVVALLTTLSGRLRDEIHRGPVPTTRE